MMELFESMDWIYRGIEIMMIAFYEVAGTFISSTLTGRFRLGVAQIPAPITA